MKVLMFGWEFPPNISGGLGTACFGLTRGLSSFSDIDVLFVVPKAHGNESKNGIELIDAGEVTISNCKLKFDEFTKTVDYIAVESNIVPYIDPKDYKYHLSKIHNESNDFLEVGRSGQLKMTGKYGADLLSEVAKYSFIAKDIAATYKFDIIHAHDWLTYPAGINAKEVSGKPLVVHVHATDFDRSGKNVNKEVYAIEKMGFEAADRIISVSDLTKEIVVREYGIDPAKIFTVYNAVEPLLPAEEATCQVPLKKKIVTFLGRITYQKGPEYFVQAAIRVLERMENVWFVMAGSGDMMEKTVKRVAEAKIADKFFFTGFLKGKEVFELLQISDIYVMPSVSEPFGISVLEAMQSGVPVIVSKQSGVAEILNHVIKVDFWDIDALADAIHGIISYPVMSKMLSKSGMEEAELLKWENSAAKVREIYRLALSA